MLFKLFLFFCVYLPFQIALSPGEGVDLASSRIFILVLFFLWCAENLKKRRFILESSLTNFFLISFLFLNLLSMIVAKNQQWSLRKLLFLFSIIPLYFVVADLINTKEKMEKVIKYLVFSGFFVAILGIFQFFSQFIFKLDATYRFWASYISPLFLGENVTEAVLRNPSWLVNISSKTYLRAIAIFPDPHMLSFFLGMLLPFALGLFLKLKNKVYLFIFIVLLLADFLTFSRGGYLGLFAGAAVTFLLLFNKINRKYKIRTVFFIIFFSGFLVFPGPIAERFFSSFNFKEGSNQGRIEIWKKASEVALKNPIIGVGIGNYPLEISATASYRDPIYAHSNYLDIAAETGLVNLFLWLGFSSSLIFVFLAKSKDILFFCAALSIIIFSTHSLVETSIYSPVVLPLFLIIAGFSFLAKTNEKNI